MRCDNYFCAYWREGHCILKEIALNIQGICQECIYIEFPDKVLEENRKKTLEHL